MSEHKNKSNSQEMDFWQFALLNLPVLKCARDIMFVQILQISP